MANDIELMEEIIAEDMEIMEELFQEDVLPLIQHQQQLEKKAFEKAYKELKALEEEETEKASV